MEFPSSVSQSCCELVFVIGHQGDNMGTAIMTGMYQGTSPKYLGMVGETSVCINGKAALRRDRPWVTRLWAC